MSRIKTILNQVKYNLFLALLLALALLVPDYIAKIFTENNQAAISKIFVTGIFALSFFLSFSPRKIVFWLVGFFLIIELIQFSHLFYYGNLITASKLKLLVEDFDEVCVASKEAISYLYFVPLIVALPYSLIFWGFKKFEKHRFRNNYALIFVFLILALIPYRVNKAYSGVNYYPDPADHSLRNSLYAFCNATINAINPKIIDKKQYQAYEIKPIASDKSKKTNVILIIGEGINYHHMSLFGYKRNTNPMLEQLKKDPKFNYLAGISSGVSTIVSIPLLVNGIYEPNNYGEIENKTVNLFKLAKQHSFKTFYISAQTGALLSNLSPEYIDYKIFRKKEEKLFNELQDEALLKIIAALDYEDNNFLVINQRNAHTPYEGNYQHNKSLKFFPVDFNDFNKFKIDTYDNAMLYNDYILFNLIKFFAEKFKDGPTYIYFTSDHGEGLGDPVYGHSILLKSVAEVPFLSYVINDELPNIKEPICHYEVHKLVARALGFEIINPNVKKDTCYIQGTDLYGINEFMEVKK